MVTLYEYALWDKEEECVFLKVHGRPEYKYLGGGLYTNGINYPAETIELEKIYKDYYGNLMLFLPEKNTRMAKRLFLEYAKRERPWFADNIINSIMSSRTVTGH